MTILTKHICIITLVDEGDRRVEYTPFHVNMLNAVEDVTGRKHAEVEIEQKDRRHWIVTYTSKHGKPRRVEIIGTDEELGDKYREQETPDMFSGTPKLRGPTFK